MSNSVAGRMEALGKQGCVVSVAYGPAGDGSLSWSVNVMNRNHETFNKPFAAASIEQCLDIAEAKVSEMGWGMPKLMVAREEGGRAFEEGKTLLENPYPSFTKANVEWSWGYLGKSRYAALRAT